MYVFSNSHLTGQTQSKADVIITAKTEVLGHREAPLIMIEETAELSDVFVFYGETCEPEPDGDDLLLDPVFGEALALAMSNRAGSQAATGGQEMPVPQEAPEPEMPEPWDRVHHDAMMSTIQNLMYG